MRIGNEKKVLLLAFYLCCFIPLSLFGQCNLTIKIEGLKNSKGHVQVEISNDKRKCISAFILNIEKNTSMVVVKKLTLGRYSFKYFHDENGNYRLDVNGFGIPKEGFGFSNNAKGMFGPPAFWKTVFELKGDQTLKCTPSYIFCKRP
jgi:uncharacterized protein (DUF2141 family)